jgi:hypothetical protein
VLLVKQACHRLASGSNSATHIAQWGKIAAFGNGPHAKDIPPAFVELAALLKKEFSLTDVGGGEIHSSWYYAYDIHMIVY